MSIPDDEVQELARLYPDVQRAEEAGATYFLIPQLPLPAGQTPNVTDVLFCPGGRDGYPSRLFLGVQLPHAKSPNWTAVRILERNWYAVSWRIREDLRLVQKLRAHLDAFR